ncbi:hypothetical protein K431DRAFT_289813 [Polychaeton citri CBS 116435]|uniref:Uncharacterized protein n=1 Tax=Polychaeton citri CBS 116435 TaxID=1314669 RepID=A0A9P4UJ41_9PEZI|nr:hypothetical protein K431DRAFT_289813 [Polychaeton citri CBS 116435]
MRLVLRFAVAGQSGCLGMTLLPFRNQIEQEEALVRGLVSVATHRPPPHPCSLTAPPFPSSPSRLAICPAAPSGRRRSVANQIPAQTGGCISVSRQWCISLHWTW